MSDSLLFIGVARRLGYSSAAAQGALAAVRARLSEAGVVGSRLYIFRTGDGGAGGGGGEAEAEAGAGEPVGRQRMLLAFQSPDAALAFAQGAGLGASPRLVALSLGQLLAALVQRPSIGALHVVAEGEPGPPGALPPGTRIERAALIELLVGVTP